MSTDTDDPTTDDHRRTVLEDNREVFETISESDRVSRRFRRKFGEQPLEILDDLQEGKDA